MYKYALGLGVIYIMNLPIQRKENQQWKANQDIPYKHKSTISRQLEKS